MSDCLSIRSQFSEYLDGAVSGGAMHAIASHLEGCQECTTEFAEWRTLQRVLTSIGPRNLRPIWDCGFVLPFRRRKRAPRADALRPGSCIGKILCRQYWYAARLV